MKDILKQILSVGCGGFSLEIIKYLKDYSDYNPGQIQILGFLDPYLNNVRKKQALLACKKKVKFFKKIKDIKLKKNVYSLIAIGNPIKREKCKIELKKNKIKLFTLIHPKSFIYESSKIAPGCIAAPFSYVGPMAKLEENVILNIFSSVGHHSIVKKSSILSPYATLNSKSTVGNMSFLGTHSTVVTGASLGDNSKLSAGSILYTRLSKGMLANGNPAEPILKLKW